MRDGLIERARFGNVSAWGMHAYATIGHETVGCLCVSCGIGKIARNRKKLWSKVALKISDRDPGKNRRPGKRLLNVGGPFRAARLKPGGVGNGARSNRGRSKRLAASSCSIGSGKPPRPGRDEPDDDVRPLPVQKLADAIARGRQTAERGAADPVHRIAAVQARGQARLALPFSGDEK